MADLNFVVTLAVGFASAFLAGALAMRLRQSPIVGYLAAGLLLGPFTPGITADVDTTRRLADFGVILLLFAVGVHFSLAELLRLRVVAGGGGLAQLILTTGLGTLAGIALGWSPLASLFLGSAVAISSSAVLAKVLAERGEEGSAHGTIAMAWMIVQDLATIGILVLLSGLSGSGNLQSSVALATLKAVIFVGVLLIAGMRILPWLFDRIAALNSRELFLVAITALSLGTAYLAEQLGISLALGAFLAGLVLSESDLSHHILGEIAPVRDLFSVLFFVSIGMLVNPAEVAHALPAFLLIVVLIVVVKGAISSGIILALGYPARTALLAGVGIAQAGEFSFVLARLGRDAGVLSQERFTLILAAATASILIGPALFLILGHVANALDARWLSRPVRVSEGAASPLYQDHVVVCGYGRVGAIVARVLHASGTPLVVVEQNRDIVNRLRAEGRPVVFGNAANPYVLDAAGVRRAAAIVVALPDSLDARRVVDEVRRLRPDVDIVVRAHSEREQAELLSHGASDVVVAEQELGLEMVRHILRHAGTSEAVIDGLLLATRGALENQGSHQILT